MVAKSFQRNRFDRLYRRWLKWLAIGLLGMVLQFAVPSHAQTSNPGATQVQLQNRATFIYDSGGDPASRQTLNGGSNATSVKVEIALTDPPGRVTGCSGEVLPTYNGFTVGLYDPLEGDATGTAFGRPTPLVPTEVPDRPDNLIPLGLAPNVQNANPFPLTDGEQGGFNFLLDAKRGQLDLGRSYILVINPPANTVYDQRRIKITFVNRVNEVISYTAISLDGKPLNANDNRTSITGTINLRTSQADLALASLNVGASLCQTQEIQVVKTGDRAAAEPGDTVIYRLAVRNLSSTSLTNLTVADTLPQGFELLANSLQAEFNGSPVAITSSRDGSTITLKANNFLLPIARTNRGTQTTTLNIAYAARLTPDSVRGSGRNSAVVTGQRIDNRLIARDGPAVHQLRIQPGILSDCGTLIGRVFVDNNFDGEQQIGEVGIANAVIFMDDGNRIVTDANGLFSLANVISGYRTAVLDLTSLPGYMLAPNQYFIERNSQSRLVKLEPGGLARVNFAVTPAFQEGVPR